VQPVLIPLGSDPPSQFEVFAVVARDIAMLVDFAIVGKLTQTIFPDGAVADPPFKIQASQFLDTESASSLKRSSQAVLCM
jgi:hypothetical protein